MERIVIYQGKKRGSKIFMIYAIIIFLIGILFLIYRLIAGFRIGFPDGDWNSVLVPVLGIFFFFSEYSKFKMKDFFIEWDDEILSYLLPNSKETVTIKLSDIKKVEIDLLDIKMQVSEKEITMSLRVLPFKELRRIKEKFEELKRTTDEPNPIT